MYISYLSLHFGCIVASIILRITSTDLCMSHVDGRAIQDYTVALKNFLKGLGIKLNLLQGTLQSQKTNTIFHFNYFPPITLLSEITKFKVLAPILLLGPIGTLIEINEFFKRKHTIQPKNIPTYTHILSACNSKMKESNISINRQYVIIYFYFGIICRNLISQDAKRLVDFLKDHEPSFEVDKEYAEIDLTYIINSFLQDCMFHSTQLQYTEEDTRRLDDIMLLIKELRVTPYEVFSSFDNICTTRRGINFMGGELEIYRKFLRDQKKISVKIA